MKLYVRNNGKRSELRISNKLCGFQVMSHEGCIRTSVVLKFVLDEPEEDFKEAVKAFYAESGAIHDYAHSTNALEKNLSFHFNEEVVVGLQA